MLHRRIVACVAAMVCLAGIATPQSKPKINKAPRALAVVEWPPKGQPRLVPITVLIDGRYYNASIYLADPVPLALDTGTVYQVEQSGESTGFFTVTAAAQQQGGSWVGVGNFRTNEQIAAAAAAAAKKRAPPPKEKEEGPPKLRRGGRSRGSNPQPSPNPPDTTSSPSNTPDTTSSDDDRPKLKRPQTDSTPSQPSSQDDDDRPRLKRPADQQPASTPASTPTSTTAGGSQPGQSSAGSGTQPAAGTQAGAAHPDEANAEDAGRPILRRGGQIEQANSIPVVEAPRGASRIASTPGPAATGGTLSEPKRVLAAISDSRGGEPKSYTWEMKPEEKLRITNGVQALASAALNSFAQAHNGHAGKLEDADVRMYDLSYSNEPYIILTARAETVAAPAPTTRTRAAAAKAPAPTPAAPAHPVTYYVTFVAREDFDGNLRKVYSSVTDTEHLDAWPRLQLVDAVDVDGNGRGDLLFRATSDTDSSYIVYGVSSDQMTAIFNSGALQR